MDTWYSNRRMSQRIRRATGAGRRARKLSASNTAATLSLVNCHGLQRLPRHVQQSSPTNDRLVILSTSSDFPVLAKSQEARCGKWCDRSRPRAQEQALRTSIGQFRATILGPC